MQDTGSEDGAVRGVARGGRLTEGREAGVDTGGVVGGEQCAGEAVVVLGQGQGGEQGGVDDVGRREPDARQREQQARDLVALRRCPRPRLERVAVRLRYRGRQRR